MQSAATASQLRPAVRVGAGRRSSAAGALLRGATRKQQRPGWGPNAISNKLVLVPTGDGTTDHLGMKVEIPGSLTLNDGINEVGREQPADLIVPVPTVSGRHAIIKVEGDSVTICDLNSTNGTFVEGQQLQPMDVMPIGLGTEIVLGDMFLARYRLVEIDDDLEPVTNKTDLVD